MTCNCVADWRLELLNLEDGLRRRYVVPTSFQFEQLLNGVGSGSVTFPVREVSIQDVWPHLTSVAITRIDGPGASATNPVAEFIGLVEEIDASSNGSVTLGLKSIEQYLAYQLVPRMVYEDVDQTEIGADLVNEGALPSVLSGEFVNSSVTRDRTYKLVDFGIVLERVLQLTGVINGPDYRLEHSPKIGGWETIMWFEDYIGNETPRPLPTQRGIVEYSLRVDATNHVTQVTAVGEDSTVRFTATDSSSIYPEFERSKSWPTVKRESTIQDHAEGELENNLHPLATPQITVTDLDLSTGFALGDALQLKMNHGAIQYDGVARLVGKAWGSSGDEPTTCTFTLVPLEDAGTAILGASASPGPACC